jgi:hypothetical protein
MSASRSSHRSRLAAAAVAASVALALGSGSVFAGEITGNGQLKAVNGRSPCAYSGQEDLQWYTTDDDTSLKDTFVRGDPGHAQSWGQIPKAVRDQLTLIGMNPGIDCNPNLSTFGS